MKTDYSNSIIIPILSILCAPWPAASGQALPADGQSLAAWQVEARRPPEGFGPGQVWDLSSASADEIVAMDFKWFGDSLAARAVGGARDWYVLRADGSVWSLGSSDRLSSSMGRSGAPFLLPGADSAADLDTLSQSWCSLADRTAGVSWEYSSSLSGSLLLPGGELAEGTTLVRAAVADSLWESETLRWLAPGAYLLEVETESETFAKKIMVTE